MNRLEFMSALETALSDIPENERAEALQYYNDYLDDAGVEGEQEVMEALGEPRSVAQTIREGLEGKAESGEFTEKGFSGRTESCPPQAWDARGGKNTEAGDGEYRYHNAKASSDGKKKKINSWKIVSIVLLCLILGPIVIPVVLGLVAAILSVLLGVLVAIGAVIACCVVVGFCLLAVGLLVGILGVSKLFLNPAGALVVIGGGLIAAAIGLLILIFFGWILCKLIPLMIRGLVNLCRKPFHRKKGGKRG